METIEKKRVLVVDGIALTRFAMRSIVDLHPLVRVFGEARDVPEARQRCQEGKPDLAVLDLRLPRADGLDLLREFRNFHPPMKLLVVSEEEDLTIVCRAFKCGASAYVSKLDQAGDLLCAIEDVLGGRRYASPRVAEGLLGVLTSAAIQKRDDEVRNLSNREFHIFRLLGSKSGATAIARELGITVKTVETHQMRLKEKLHVTSCGELRRRAEVWVGGHSGRLPSKPKPKLPKRSVQRASLEKFEPLDRDLAPVFSSAG